MPKITLGDLANIYGNPTSAQNTVNENNTLIEEAFENTLSRDGSAPNQMNADIDLNNNDLLNVNVIDAKSFRIEGSEDFAGLIAEAKEAAVDSRDAADDSLVAAEIALDAAERAENAAAGVESPVSYVPQSLTASQQAQARLNIGSAIKANMTITVGVGGDFSTLQAAYDSIDRPIAPGVYVTIQVLGHLTKATSAYTLTADHPYGQQILIRGLPTVDTTLTNITSVTGSAGNWSVTATVADATNIAVNDIIRVKDVVPGYVSIYTYTGFPAIGELRMPRVQLGKIYTSGTTATTGAGDLNTMVNIGSLVLMKGEVRRVSAINTPTTFTMVTGGLTADIASNPRLNWWWYARPNSGSVAISGTAVTGTSTLNTTQLNRGDYIMVQNGTVVRVTNIASDTSMTIERSLGTVAAGKWIAPVVRGHHHEGGWRVTAVAGNQVTWTNTSRSPYAPPINRVTGGTLQVHKSSIQDTGAGNGIRVYSFLDIDQLAIVGDLGTGAYGLNFARLEGKAPQGKLGTKTVILGYDNCLYSDMSEFEAGEVSFCGAREAGVYARDGTSYKAFNSVVNGCGTKGFVVYGGYVNLTGARSMGNGDDGLWVRSGICIAESFVSEDNGRGGIWVVGTGKCEAVQSRIMGNAYGIAWEHGGASCRYPGALIVGNTVNGIHALQAGASHAEDINLLTNGVGLYTESITLLNLQQSGYAYNGTNRTVSALSTLDEALILQTP